MHRVERPTATHFPKYGVKSCRLPSRNPPCLAASAKIGRICGNPATSGAKKLRTTVCGAILQESKGIEGEREAVFTTQGFILALNQYKRIGCSPGKHFRTQMTAIGSDDDSRDSAHDRCLYIAV